MGSSADRLKTCCAHTPCDSDQFADKIQISPIAPNLVPQATLQDNNAEKNKEIIASHLRPPPKMTLETVPTSRSAIPAEEAKTAPKLKIKLVTSTGNTPKGTELEINAQGLEGALRGAKDGITYFGCDRYDRTKSEPVLTQLNDFVIPIKEAEMADRHYGRHFQIEYDTARKKYFIRDLGKGFGVFVRIDYPQVFLAISTLSLTLIYRT